MAVVPASNYSNDLDYWDYRRRLWRDWDLIDWDVPYWKRLARVGSAPDLSRVIVGKDGFEACVDVHQFKPYEITVKTIADTVIVEAKHDKRRDGDSFVGRHIVKRFVLPRGHYPNDVRSELTSDGILVVRCPPTSQAERSVYVRQVGPYLSIKN
ncbi:heat shock protein 27-like [Teleopsis dalmanni]|uniref:heat shock protein 27-like n=1 Tax=Teleopsis dalmanni TaxID=139649 RepID=UPI0018CE8643|nr:heat shock protein 27-like [Teleopsis dalmanni]XP_037939320.1 heat shock protein 27-like [Teleopsis dalmanni]